MIPFHFLTKIFFLLHFTLIVVSYLEVKAILHKLVPSVYIDYGEFWTTHMFAMHVNLSPWKRGILVIEGNHHSALAFVSDSWKVHIGTYALIDWSAFLCHQLEIKWVAHLLAISLKVETGVGVSWLALVCECASFCWAQ